MYAHSICFPDLSPLHLANGKIITSVSEGTPADVDRAVKAARRAYETSWGLKAPGGVRAKLLGNLANLVDEHFDELAALEALDNGTINISFLP